MSAPQQIQDMVGLIEPHADELDDKAINKIFDAARRLHSAGYRLFRPQSQAFPTYLGNQENWDLGMTQRDYFAAHAMSAIISGDAYRHAANLASRKGVEVAEYIATSAYEHADAMMKARAR